MCLGILPAYMFVYPAVTRRGQIPSGTGVTKGHHVGTENQTQPLWKSGQFPKERAISEAPDRGLSLEMHLCTAVK